MVRGYCASSRCRPRTCTRQMGEGAMGLSDLYRGRKVALHILSSQEDQRIHNLETIREGLLTVNHCFVLWPGKFVPRRIKDEVSRAIVPEENDGKCVTVLPLPKLLWGAESKDKKRFTKRVLAVLEPQPVVVEGEVENGNVAGLLPGPTTLSPVDALRLIDNLFPARPVAADVPRVMPAELVEELARRVNAIAIANNNAIADPEL